MNVLLTFIISTGFVILSLSRGRDAFIPSHMSSREDVTTLTENSTYNEKYRYAMKKTLDVLWVMKCHVIEIREYHRRLEVFDGGMIEYLNDLFDRLQEYLNLLGEIITKVLESREDIQPWHRFNPVNETVVDKLLTEWSLIKSHIDYYQPNRAVQEYKKMCQLANSAIRELPLQYKPVQELMVELHNETYNMSEDERARMAEETTIINLRY